MRWLRKIFGFVVGLVLVAVVWFYRVNSPFQSDSTTIETFKYFERTTDELRLVSRCTGFVGVCEFSEFGLRLELSFEGFTLRKPSPQFLNMSGFGDRRGWRLATNYYGWRELRLLNSTGVVLGKFRQFLWNTTAYSDFGQILAVDVASRKLFVSQRQFGFMAVNEPGWVVRY